MARYVSGRLPAEKRAVDVTEARNASERRCLRLESTRDNESTHTNRRQTGRKRDSQGQARGVLRLHHSVLDFTLTAALMRISPRSRTSPGRRTGFSITTSPTAVNWK